MMLAVASNRTRASNKLKLKRTGGGLFGYGFDSSSADFVYLFIIINNEVEE